MESVVSQNPDRQRYEGRTPVTESNMSTEANTRMVFVGHHAASGHDLWLYERLDVPPGGTTSHIRFARFSKSPFHPRWMGATKVARKVSSSAWDGTLKPRHAAYRFAYRRAVARGLIHEDGTLKAAL